MGNHFIFLFSMLEGGVLLHTYVFFLFGYFSKEIYDLSNMICVKLENQENFCLNHTHFGYINWLKTNGTKIEVESQKG
jgi:hypothetical protein